LFQNEEKIYAYNNMGFSQNRINCSLIISI